MKPDLDHPLIIAISSSALFDLKESDAIYQTQGVKVYSEYQIAHENDPLKPGIAFALVKRFLSLNDDGKKNVGVVLLSRNSADTGLRVFNSIDHYGLKITCAAFTSGEPPYAYARPYGANLFLSDNETDVRAALDKNIAAAKILPSPTDTRTDKQLRIAFDGDAVIFSDAAEQVFQKQGLHEFSRAEKNAADEPLPSGPFKSMLAALHKLQQTYSREESPLRTALITARSAPAHERVIKTLRAWNIRIDESLFLGGLEKGEFLRAFRADIFFDDQMTHCNSAREHVTTGHVPSGIVNA